VDEAPTNMTALTPSDAKVKDAEPADDVDTAGGAGNMASHINKVLGRERRSSQQTPVKQGRGGKRPKTAAVAFYDNKRGFAVVAESITSLKGKKDIFRRGGEKRISSRTITQANQGGTPFQAVYKSVPVHIIMASPAEVAKLKAKSTRGPDGKYEFGTASAPAPQGTNE